MSTVLAALRGINLCGYWRAPRLNKLLPLNGYFAVRRHLYCFFAVRTWFRIALCHDPNIVAGQKRNARSCKRSLGASLVAILSTKYPVRACTAAFAVSASVLPNHNDVGPDASGSEYRPQSTNRHLDWPAFGWGRLDRQGSSIVQTFTCSVTLWAAIKVVVLPDRLGHDQNNTVGICGQLMPCLDFPQVKLRERAYDALGQRLAWLLSPRRGGRDVAQSPAHRRVFVNLAAYVFWRSGATVSVRAVTYDNREWHLAHGMRHAINTKTHFTHLYGAQMDIFFALLKSILKPINDSDDMLVINIRVGIVTQLQQCFDISNISRNTFELFYLYCPWLMDSWR